MERFITAHRPPVIAAAGLARRQMPTFLLRLAQALGRALRAAGQPAPPPPDLPAWRSYAVYSGALPLSRHKSSRRLP